MPENLTVTLTKPDEVIPTREELIARARALLPLLRERADEDERNRCVNPDTIQRLKDAGLFLALQSRRWGGYESGQRAFAEIQMTLAEGDMSVGWVYGILGVHSYHMCLLDDRAAKDVWEKDNTVLVASPYMPGGKAKPVPGGYELSGRWAYSSGCDHCPWTFLGGLVDGNPGDFRSFLLPREDAKIVDAWHTAGLAATGSQDIVVENAFIPEYRTHRFIDGFTGESPGRAVNDGPLYRMPFQLVFMRAITNAQIGALQALLDLFIGYAKQKMPIMGSRTTQNPDAQFAIADAMAGIADMKHTMFANFETMSEYAERNEMPPLETRHLFRFQCASVAERCIRLAEPLIQASGGGAVYNRTNMSRIYRNMLMARQHAAAQHRGYGRTFGDLLFGGEVNDILL
jgi:3-hydroxy-9,10-secoandrosta-1,3,5(10)-triene-9,17-dione monooxygenase